MSEQVSRSYAVRTNPARDPIRDAVTNLGMGDSSAPAPKKAKRHKPLELEQFGLTDRKQPLRSVPNPFVIVDKPIRPVVERPQPSFDASRMYLPKAPDLGLKQHSTTSIHTSLAAPEASILTPSGESVYESALQLVLPSSFPKPPPIAMPLMQQPPKFTPLPEPVWEKSTRVGGMTEAERFKASFLRQNEEPVKKKKKRKAKIQAGRPASDVTARPEINSPEIPGPEIIIINRPVEVEPVPEETPRQERRRRRRTLRRADGTQSGGLTRGASMRRRNVWDDVPEFVNPDNQTIEEVDENEQGVTQSSTSGPTVITEPAPPPFPYPTPGGGGLPPAFNTVVPEGTDPGRRSPPPSWEIVMGLNQQDEPEQLTFDIDSEIPPSPSTTSSLRQERLRNETRAERRRREERERWTRMREQGTELEEMVRREQIRMERMSHWDRDDSAPTSDDEARFSKADKGKGKEVYYDAPDEVIDTAPSAGISRATSFSNGLTGRGSESSHVPVHMGLNHTAGEQNGEGSKMSGFVMQELAAAGVDIDELMRENQELPLAPDEGTAIEAEVLPALPISPAAESNLTTPLAEIAEDTTILGLEPEHVSPEPEPTSPVVHGSKFVEAIREIEDGEFEITPGVIDLPEDNPSPLAEKDSPLTRKPSLPPLFGRKRSTRKISNPWALFRQVSGVKPDKPNEEIPSPTNEAPAGSPKEAGLALSPFFRAAGNLLKPGLGVVEQKKEKTPVVPVAPIMTPPSESLPTARPRAISRTSDTATPSPVVYKHPFNRAVKPAWMQNAAPIWRDPKAYLRDEDRVAETVERNAVDSAVIQPITPTKAVTPLQKLDGPKSSTLIPISLRDEGVVAPGLLRQDSQPRTTETVKHNFPPPILASQFMSTPETASESDADDLDSESSSSDDWSVSDAVPRPPAAYRLLPPRGIPANVLRASDEPPPLPRRNRENRPRPMGPRARGAPPPLPPRATPPTPITAEVSKEGEMSLPIEQPPLSMPEHITVQTKVIPLAPALPPANRRMKSALQASKGVTIDPNNMPSSTRPTAGDRTPSGVSSKFNSQSEEAESRQNRSRSHSAGLKPLTPTIPASSPKLDSYKDTKGFDIAKPPRPAAVASRPKPLHHRTAPNEHRRQTSQQTKLAIKPRFDDRPEQEMKSQLSNRINKWRLNATRPDPPETWEPGSDEESIVTAKPNGMPRSKSMPNVRKEKEESPPADLREASGAEQVVVGTTGGSGMEEGSRSARSRDVSSPSRIQSTPSLAQPARIENTTALPASPGLEFTDLDLVAARLQGTDQEYEAIHAITSFVGDEIPRGASPDRLANLLIAPVEIESKRTTKEGKTKLKLTALGVRVLKCSICLSQFKAGDILAMMPGCGHVGHQKCSVNWLTKDARCTVCREPL